MIEFDEANDVAPATATIAVEQVLVRVNEKAGLMVGVQRTQPQKAAGADGPGLLPIVCLPDTPATESAVSVHREPFESCTAGLDPQNTAHRAEIPGKDGGCSQKVPAPSSGL